MLDSDEEKEAFVHKTIIGGSLFSYVLLLVCIYVDNNGEYKLNKDRKMLNLPRSFWTMLPIPHRLPN